MSFVAYVDESMRQRRDGSGLYVLAAALVDDAVADDVRRELVELVSGSGSRRVHWRDEQPARRRKIISAVATLESLHLVVVGVGLENARQERGRRRCLESLLWHLSHQGIRHVLLDRRTESLNRKDIALVDVLRVRGAMDESTRVDFGRPYNGRDGDVLLWLPDIVAGAVSAAFGDGDSQYLSPLESLVEVHHIELA